MKATCNLAQYKTYQQLSPLSIAPVAAEEVAAPLIGAALYCAAVPGAGPGIHTAQSWTLHGHAHITPPDTQLLSTQCQVPHLSSI